MLLGFFVYAIVSSRMNMSNSRPCSLHRNEVTFPKGSSFFALGKLLRIYFSASFALAFTVSYTSSPIGFALVTT